MTLYYAGNITSGSTVAVSNASSAVNSGLFYLTNTGYGLVPLGTDLIIKPAQVAPTGPTGAAPTLSGGTDGKITGTTTNMEYKLSTAADSTYTACNDTNTTVGATGSYSVRLKATGLYAPSAPVTVVVPVNASSGSQSGLFNANVSFSIAASAGVGRTISPSGGISVSSGGSQTYTISANSGYKISDILVDGSSIGAVSSYTFSDVAATHISRRNLH